MAKSRSVAIKDRIKELRRVRASSLVPNPKNWRTHPDAQKAAMAGVLKELGIVGAVLARELEDGRLMLIDGHLRSEQLADATVPVLVLDVNESEADKILATLDPLAAMADKDSERLASLLGELKECGDDLAPLVWPDYIVDPLLAADWTPAPAVDDSARKDAKKDTSITFTVEQFAIIERAVEMYRRDEQDAVATESACIASICKEYVAE